MSFATCCPPKSSLFTLLSSGSILGLAPSPTHRRITDDSFLDKLMDEGVIHEKIWSITLLDANSGILTFGGTTASEMEEARVRSEVELEFVGEEHPAAMVANVDYEVSQRLSTFPANLQDQFKWLTPLGASGWWTPLLSGLWVNGVKVLKNQPVLLDVQCPLILAPPLAARRFYESIGGSRRLPEPNDRFWVTPCSNAANIGFEFAGWTFPGLKGETRDDTVQGPRGGPQSLGLWKPGTGYCVGVVVESRMEDVAGARTGLQDTWVFGEPFFRSMGVAFDLVKNKIGFRTF